jgi:hypothetical protein
MSETIPADVMAEAQKQTAWLRDNEEEHGELHDRVISLVIARAILSERDRATAEIRELRDALEELIDTLTPAEREPIKDIAHSDEVRRLGLRIGFGALMAAADYEWREHLARNGSPVGGEFVAGPCRSVLQYDMKRARAAIRNPMEGRG